MYRVVAASLPVGAVLVDTPHIEATLHFIGANTLSLEAWQHMGVLHAAAVPLRARGLAEQLHENGSSGAFL